MMELTLEDLAREVAARIQRADVRQGNGQVSPFPDRRTLRYYTTIGLLDRPLAMRGRQAVYGDRHVHQAVAVKRMQAAGLSLGEIQTRLAGLPTPELAQVAEAEIPFARWRPAGPRTRWWTGAPAGPAAAEPVAPGPLTQSSAVAQPGMAAAAAVAQPSDGTAVTLTAVPLGGATTLLIPADRPLTRSDLDAIRRAAAPLTDYLAAAGLTGPRAVPKERS